MSFSIFICEDDNAQRAMIEKTIFSYIAEKDYDMKIVLSTGDPEHMLSYLDLHPQKKALYFLDIDLQHQIHGIALAQKIRDYDLGGWIIFVTTHAELTFLTFRHRIEAMDYIIKDNRDAVVEQVQECIDIAFSRSRTITPEAEYFQVKSSMGVQKIPISDITYFEAQISHKIILHTENKRIEFRGSLKEVLETSPNFFKCHKAYVVNTNHVIRVRRVGTLGEAELTGGTVIPVGKNRLASLKKALKA